MLRSHRRWISIAIAASLALVLAVGAVVATAAAPTIARISGNGGSGQQGSWGQNITPNGRFIVFNSYSAELAPGDTNNTRDTFLYDVQSGTVKRVNLTPGGQQGNGESHTGYASADGRYVAFSSMATNFATDATGAFAQVFLKDLVDGGLRLVSVTPLQHAGNGYSSPEGMSSDGRYVAIYSYASDLVAGDTNQSQELFLCDLQTGDTERLAVSSDEVQGDKGSWGGAISPDARFAVFNSESTNLVPGDTNGVFDIFLRDRQQGTTELVSVGTGGQPANGESYDAALTPDGRYVVFDSWGSNLVVGDTNNAEDIFIRDRLMGTTERVSLTDSGTQANGNSYDPDVSADGRYVVFSSDAGDLVPGDTNGNTDVFLRDRVAGTTTRLSVAGDGSQATGGDAMGARLSADGRYVVFASGFPDLVAGDTNGAYDVFLVDRGPQGPAVPAFTDIATSPYKTAIESLAGAGIINGYNVDDHWEFRPGDKVKRAQFAKMIVGSWGFTVTEGQSYAPFTDLGADNLSDLYPHEYVGVAYAKGITKGTTATTFGPYVDIKRAQLITMVVRSMQEESPASLETPPAAWKGALPTSDPTHGMNIKIAEYNGLLDGIALGGWDIWGPATRGETAQILYNMRGM